MFQFLRPIEWQYNTTISTICYKKARIIYLILVKIYIDISSVNNKISHRVMDDEQAYQILGSTPPDSYIGLYKQIFQLYQLCTLPNKKSVHQIRKYVVNAGGQLVSVRQFNISQQKLKRLKMVLEPNELVYYDTTSLNEVPDLDEQDILNYKR